MHLATRRPLETRIQNQGFRGSRDREIHGQLRRHDTEIHVHAAVFRVIPFKHAPSHVVRHWPERQVALRSATHLHSGNPRLQVVSILPVGWGRSEIEGSGQEYLAGTSVQPALLPQYHCEKGAGLVQTSRGVRTLGVVDVELRCVP